MRTVMVEWWNLVSVMVQMMVDTFMLVLWIEISKICAVQDELFLIQVSEDRHSLSVIGLYNRFNWSVNYDSQAMCIDNHLP